MKKFLYVVMLLLTATSANAQIDLNQYKDCKKNMSVNPLYLGQDKERLERRVFVLCQENYVSYFDPMTKTPLWVAEKVTQDVNVKRVNNFAQNPNVPRGAQANINDYTHSGFDKGHMAPAANMMNDNAMIESFYLTNMVPQVGPNMNRGIWADLEDAVRQIANKDGIVYVYSGPIFDKTTQFIGKSKVWVPTELYKIIYRPKTQQFIAFIMPNRQIITEKTKTLDKGNEKMPQTTPEMAVNCGKVCRISNFQVDMSLVEQKTRFKFK